MVGLSTVMFRDVVHRRDGDRGAGHLLEITAGAERLVTLAGEDENLRFVVLIEAAQAAEQSLPDRLAQTVPGVGTRDGQPRDVVDQLVSDDVVHSWSPPLITTSVSPVSTCAPRATGSRDTVPAAGDLIECSIFMASSTITV
jgi:hypothetical protein